MSTAEEFRSIIAPLFPGLMGVEIETVTPEKVVAGMLVRPDLCTTGGACHGGALMAFADTVGAVGTVANLPPGARTTTIESKTNFIRAVRDGYVESHSRPLHTGKTVIVVETDLRDDRDRLVARVTQSQLVLAG